MGENAVTTTSEHKAEPTPLPMVWYENGTFSTIPQPDWMTVAEKGKWVDLEDNLDDVGVPRVQIIGASGGYWEEGYGDYLIVTHIFLAPDRQSYYVEVRDDNMPVWSVLMPIKDFPRFHVEMIAPLRPFGWTPGFDHRSQTGILSDLHKEVQRLADAVVILGQKHRKQAGRVLAKLSTGR
jgi:hypothetical protein